MTNILDQTINNVMPIESFEGHHKDESDRKKEFYRHKIKEGYLFYGASNSDHDEIMKNMLQSIDENKKPHTLVDIREYGRKMNYPPEWAESVAYQSNSKKTGRTLQEQIKHPVIQDLKENKMFTPSHKGAIQTRSYVGKGEMLFTGSQNAREKRTLLQRVADLELRMLKGELRMEKAEAQLASFADWKEKSEEMREEGISYGEIARTLGKPKPTIVSHLKKNKKPDAI